MPWTSPGEQEPDHATGRPLGRGLGSFEGSLGVDDSRVHGFSSSRNTERRSVIGGIPPILAGGGLLSRLPKALESNFMIEQVRDGLGPRCRLADVVKANACAGPCHGRNPDLSFALLGQRKSAPSPHRKKLPLKHG